jgi:arylsulfatase A-like enzyme
MLAYEWLMADYRAPMRYATFAALGLLTALSAPARPNFLVFVGDDMRADAIHAHGNAVIRTPSIDALVAKGFSFREAHCFGANSGAVCVPSRAMLMSGRSWLHVKNDLLDVETLPAALAEKGYETFIAGKWHNGAKSCEQSFQRGEAVFLGGMTDQFHPKLARLETGRLSPARAGATFSTDAIAEAAVNFLKQRSGEKPFFAWVSFTVPHDPRTPLPKYAALYDPEKLPLPANFLPQHSFDNQWMTVRDEELLGWPRQPADVRRELARYYGLITHLDERIGDVLAVLEKSGLAENTFVIFLADHGLALGSHGLLGKQSLYEHSMRAPLIVCGPGVPAGKESRALVYLHDLHPTVLDLANEGASTAENPSTGPRHAFDGRSLVPLWRGETGRLRDEMVLAYTDTMRAVRDARWKLIVYPPINHVQLFDLAADPEEMNDLAPTEPARTAAMIERLRRLQVAGGDTQPLRVSDAKPKEIDLTGRPANPRAAVPPVEKP